MLSCVYVVLVTCCLVCVVSCCVVFHCVVHSWLCFVAVRCVVLSCGSVGL